MSFDFQTAERDFMTLTAMTGVYEIELNQFMTDKKVAVLAQPLNDRETLGGMIAVGTHVSHAAQFSWGFFSSCSCGREDNVRSRRYRPITDVVELRLGPS